MEIQLSVQPKILKTELLLWICDSTEQANHLRLCDNEVYFPSDDYTRTYNEVQLGVELSKILLKVSSNGAVNAS